MDSKKPENISHLLYLSAIKNVDKITGPDCGIVSGEVESLGQIQ